MPDGYKCIDAARPIPPGTDVNTMSLQNHGGIAVIYRSQIDVREHVLDSPTTTFEKLCCDATVSGKRFLVLCVYRPGSESVSPLFFDEFTTVLEQLLLLRHHVILCGDFNIHTDDSENWATKRLCQLLESFDCIQHVTTATHRAGHTLDLVITPRGSNVSDVMVGDLLSDHRLITFKFDVNCPSLISDWVSCRQWKKLSLPELVIDIRASQLVDMPVEFSDFSSDELANLYNKKMSQLFDKHCPIIKRRRKRCLLTPWFDADCRASRRRARMFERRYRRSQSDSDRLAWILQIKVMRQLYEQKSHHHWRTLIDNNKGDAKRLWRTFDSILRSSRHTTTAAGNTLTADEFAKFFSEGSKTYELPRRLCHLRWPLTQRRRSLNPGRQFSVTRLENLSVRRRIKRVHSTQYLRGWSKSAATSWLRSLHCCLTSHSIVDSIHAASSMQLYCRC